MLLRISTFLLCSTLLVGPASAVLEPRSVPAQCAEPCVKSAAAKAGCSLTTTDYSCICTNEVFNCAVGDCELKSCSPSDFGQLATYVAGICQPYGIRTCNSTKITSASDALASYVASGGNKTTNSTISPTGSKPKAPSPTIAPFANTGNKMSTKMYNCGLIIALAGALAMAAYWL